LQYVPTLSLPPQIYALLAMTKHVAAALAVGIGAHGVILSLMSGSIGLHEIAARAITCTRKSCRIFVSDRCFILPLWSSFLTRNRDPNSCFLLLD
jgi:hypothetical protein